MSLTEADVRRIVGEMLGIDPEKPIGFCWARGAQSKKSLGDMVATAGEYHPIVVIDLRGVTRIAGKKHGGGCDACAH